MNSGIFREYDIRGVAATDLVEEEVRRLGSAVGTLFRRRGCLRIVVARDIRLSSPRLSDDLIRGLLSVGLEVIEIGPSPTPVLYFAIDHLGSDGGVMITGSHNPPEFNGFKIMVGKSNLYGEDIQEIRRIGEAGDFPSGEGRLRRMRILDEYCDAVRQDFQPLSRSVRVAVDCGNGAAALTAVETFRSLGCDVVPLYCEPDGRFPNHHPDPIVDSNLDDLRRTVLETGAELGLAFDGDGDRLGVVDEKGRIVRADELMTVFARDLLARYPGATVIGDVKCSRRFFEAVEAMGGRPLMWKTGHSLIKAKMREEKAILAGELAAHICFGDRFLGFDDAVYAGARLIELLAAGERGLADRIDILPKMVSTPEIRRFCPDEAKFGVVERVREEFAGRFEVVTLDGIRIEFDDGWGLLRASNTQPAVVFRFEAETEVRLREIRSLVEESFTRALREISPEAEKMTSQYVLIVSDGTGETAYRLLKAASRQFETDVLITRYAKVRDKHQIEEIVRAVRRSHTLIVYTFASRELRAHMEQVAQREKLDSIDVFGPIVDKLSGFFHRRPVSKPGLLHQVDAEYFDRVDAVEFAIRHDDGESLENLDEADIVLVGVSRTSKTPLSIFLAQEGWRVANIPIGVGSILPSRLFEIDQHKIVGLVVDPERLAEARRARLEQLGMEETSYADMEMINGEMDYARAVFEQNPAWPVIDVTGKSIEEISQEVLDVVIGRGRRLQ